MIIKFRICKRIAFVVYVCKLNYSNILTTAASHSSSCSEILNQEVGER